MTTFLHAFSAHGSYFTVGGYVVRRVVAYVVIALVASLLFGRHRYRRYLSNNGGGSRRYNQGYRDGLRDGKKHE